MFKINQTNALLKYDFILNFSFLSISPILEKHESALLMILGFAGFSILLAITHNAIRKYIYKDAHSLDTVFDAGGKVTLSLTAVTVTSQLLWPADFLQITTITINVKRMFSPVNLPRFHRIIILVVS